MTHTAFPPAHLLPGDGRFGSGPSRIRDEQMEVLSRASEMGTSHRQAPVKARVHSIKDGLRGLFSIPESYEIAFGMGGATAFWAVATTSLIQHSAHAAVSGEFGAKFAADIAAAPWASVEVTEVPAGQLALIPEDAPAADTYVYTQNETSTGVASPLYRAGSSPALTLVDATSIAGATKVAWDEVDAYYFSPQKAFGSEGGLWVSVLSPAAVERAERLAGAKDRYMPSFLNLAEALKQSRLDQTLNTPAIATLVLFDEQVKWMSESGGIETMQARAHAGSTLIQDWATERPFASLFVENPEWRSPVTTTVDFAPEIDTDALAKTLRQVGIVDIEGYRKLGRNQLRFASFPSIPTQDIQALLNCLDWMIEGELR